MTPEEKFQLLKSLLERGIEVRTAHKSRRVVALEREDSRIALRYENGDSDRIHLRDFGRRRFIVIL